MSDNSSNETAGSESAYEEKELAPVTHGSFWFRQALLCADQFDTFVHQFTAGSPSTERFFGVPMIDPHMVSCQPSMGRSGDTPANPWSCRQKESSYVRLPVRNHYGRRAERIAFSNASSENGLIRTASAPPLSACARTPSSPCAVMKITGTSR